MPKRISSFSQKVARDSVPIVLSSDSEPELDEGSAFKVASKRKRKGRAVGNSSQPIVDLGVIEIFSDDESGPRKGTPLSAVGDLRREIADLNEELQTSKDNAIASSVANKSMLDKIEQEATCPMCLCLNATHILACGHNFCKGCIIQWIRSIHDEYAKAHQESYPQTKALLKNLCGLVRRQDVAEDARAEWRVKLCAAYFKAEGHPHYSCPTCRVAILVPPARAYGIHGVVRAVSELTGNGNMVMDEDIDVDVNWDDFFPMYVAQI